MQFAILPDRMVLHDSDGKNHRHKHHLLLATRPSHQTHSIEKQVSLHLSL